MEKRYFYITFQKLYEMIKDWLRLTQKEELYRLLFSDVYEQADSPLYDNDKIRKVTTGKQTIHVGVRKLLGTVTGFEEFRKSVENCLESIKEKDKVADNLLGICRDMDDIPRDALKEVEQGLKQYNDYTISRSVAALLILADLADYKAYKKIENYPNWDFMRLSAEEELPQYPELITEIAGTAAEEVIGREEEVQECLHLLQAEKGKILITGVGGLGKTVLVHQIIRKLRDTPIMEGGVEQIAWISYDNHDIRLSIKDAFSLDCELDETWLILQQLCEKNRGRLLLVIDNIESMEQDEYLRKLGDLPCRILATSRQRMLPGFDEYLIEPLTMEQCRNLFYTHYQFENRDNETVNDIINLTAKLTIMIVFLGKAAYLEELSLHELYRKLVEKGFKLSEEDVSCEHEKLQTDDTIIRQMCILFSLMEYSDADRKILTYTSVIPTLEFTVEYAKRWFGVRKNSILLKLYRMGMLEHTLKDRRHIYWMHSVIAAAVREQQKEVLYDTAAPFIHSLSEEIEFGDTWGKGYQKIYLIPFCWSVADVFEDRWEGEDDSVFLLRLYYVCFEASNYPLCTILINKVIEIDSKIGNKEMLIRDYRNLSELYLRLDEVNKAIEMLDVAQEFMKCIDPEQKNKREWANTWHKYGNVYYHMGKGLKALDYYMAALELDLQIPNLPVSELSTDYSSIAAAYQLNMDLPSAYKMLKKAVEVDDKTEVDSEMIMNYYYLATICTDLVSGGYVEYAEEGMNAFHEVIDFRERFLPKKHQDTADAYMEYANLLYLIGALDEAQKYIRMAQNIYAYIYGEDSYHILQGEGMKALILDANGESDKALALYSDVIQKEQKIENISSTDLCTDYQNYADLLEQADCYEEALNYYVKCVDNTIIDYSDDSPRLVQPYIGIANCLMGQDNYQEAVIWLEKLAPFAEEDIVLTRMVHHKAGMCYALLKNNDRAISEFEKALTLCDEHGVSDRGYILTDLCIVYRSLDNRNEAARYETLAREFAEELQDEDLVEYVHALDTKSYEK